MDPPIEGDQLSNNKVCSGHSSNRCANNSNNNNGNNNNNVGGPLMSAHLNGQVIGARGMAVASRVATSSNSVVFSTPGSASSAGSGSGSAGSDSCNPLTLSTSAGNPFNHFSANMDLEFELFPSSTWDLDGAGWADRPESRASGPPNSRPPSQPAPTASPSPQGTTFSNSAVAPPHCSPLRPFSPTTISAAHTFSNSFPFSPLQETASTLSSNAVSAVSTNGSGSGANAGSGSGTSDNVATTTIKKEEISKSGCPNNGNSAGGGNNSNSGGGGSSSGTTMDNTTRKTNSSNATVTAVESQNNSVVSTESGRLRNLLTKGPSASEDSQDNTNSDSDNQNKHRILKILLNQPDEDDYHSEHKVRTSPSNMPKSSNMEHSKPLGNNMLLQVIGMINS